MESFPYLDYFSALLSCHPNKMGESQKFKKAVTQAPQNQLKWRVRKE